MYLQSAVTLGSVSVDTSTAYNNGASLKLQGKVRRSGGTDSPALARYGGRVFLCMVIQHFMSLPTPLPTFHTSSISFIMNVWNVELYIESKYLHFKPLRLFATFTL